ncbi:hypothetical protein DXG01_010944 [Tephrocybe rancida]|nr:hypothetical protein DXG01_010944 [Tephrocybe rancida]
MSHLSPASLLVWAVLSCLLGIFLIFHLWSFDRFKCLRWNSGPASGAFKRIMTYSYLLSVPLITTFAIGFAVVKYYEGFVALPLYGSKKNLIRMHTILTIPSVIPKPYQLWGPIAQHAILPLMLCLSVGWSLEMVTHLEELCFWLFLVNSGSAQKDWFHSLYFKSWIIGSAIAVTYMPIVTVLTRSDPLKCEAYTFLAGSLGSISLTLWFTPILFTFPSFLRNLREEGVDINTIVRLTKFSELNMIRVVFRFLFTVPLLILSVDGVRPHHHINESMLWTDFLVMLAGFGCSISSGITLVRTSKIFFPRSIEGEIAARDASKERKRSRSAGYTASLYESRGAFTRTNMTQQSVHTVNYGTPVRGSETRTHLLTSSPVKQHLQLDAESMDDHYDSPAIRVTRESGRSGSMDKYWAEEERDTVANLPPLRPNRRKGADIELGGIDQMTEDNVSKLGVQQASNLNHMVHNFTSPIDLAYSSSQQPPGGGTWLSFKR